MAERSRSHRLRVLRVPGGFDYAQPPVAGFNSSLVRLGAMRPSIFGENRHVSIPAWCDWECYIPFTGTSTTLVSIPAWCDWELSFGCKDMKMRSFNSSLARLGVYVNRSSSKEMKLFQFQLGAIGSIIVHILTVIR